MNLRLVSLLLLLVAGTHCGKFNIVFNNDVQCEGQSEKQCPECPQCQECDDCPPQGGGGNGNTPDIAAFIQALQAQQIETTADQAARDAHSTDFGLLETRVPDAVVSPANANEVVAIVNAARQHGVKLVARSTGYSWDGQSLVAPTGGVIVSTKKLNQVSQPRAGIVKAGSGAIWQDVLDFLQPLGEVPAVGMGDFTGISIGGSISVGVTGGTAQRYGPSVKYPGLQKIVVVTGAGDLLEASPTTNKDLWDSVRLGLGQFGIIVEAEYQTRAMNNVRTISVIFETLAQVRSAYQVLYGRPNPPLAIENPAVDATSGLNVFTVGPELTTILQGLVAGNPSVQDYYVFSITEEYDGDTPPDPATMLAGISDIVAQAPTPIDRSYFEYLNRLTAAITSARAVGFFDSPHIALGFWVRDSVADRVADQLQLPKYLRDPRSSALSTPTVYITPSLTAPRRDIPLTRWQWDSEVVWDFQVVMTVQDATAAQQVADEFEAILQQMLEDFGGLRYAAYLVPEDPLAGGGWPALHFQPVWKQVRLAKNKYDPDNMLGGGAQMF